MIHIDPLFYISLREKFSRFVLFINLKRKHFQMFIKIFSHFFTLLFILVKTKRKLSIGKELMVLHNEKQEITFGYMLLTQK